MVDLIDDKKIDEMHTLTDALLARTKNARRALMWCFTGRKTYIWLLDFTYVILSFTSY